MEVVLREVCPEDLPALYEQQLDDDANVRAVTYARSREDFDELWSKIFADEQTVARAVVAGGELVGHINSFPLNGELWVGYWIARSHWGRGIATSVLSQFLTIMRLRPLYAQVADTNEASLRLLRRHGFQVLRREASAETERYPACTAVILRLDVPCS